jgi:hypothetical protein
MEIIGVVLIGVVCVALFFLIMWLVSKSKGKLEIQLDKYSFSAGETITGTILANLKKPVHAKSFEVGLIGESDSTNYNVNKGGVSRSHSSRNIFNFSYPIAGEGDYNPGMPPQKFQIKIPWDIISKVSTGSQVADNLIKTAMFVTGNNRKVKWYVTGRLKIPGMDLRKKVQVNIG